MGCDQALGLGRKKMKTHKESTKENMDLNSFVLATTQKGHEIFWKIFEVYKI